MERQLIGRGLLSGALAGVATFLFARVFLEPLISEAVAYESARDAARDALARAAGLAPSAHEPEVFSRTVQADAGLALALVLFGASMGAVVAVAYCLCLGRTGRIRAFPLALLVPAFCFGGAFLVPSLKYPPNPPGIGDGETIHTRGALFLVTVFLSCLFLFLAVYAGQKLHRRLDLYRTCLVAGAGYVAVMAVVFLVLPAVGHLHADVVAHGRHGSETPLPLTDAHGRVVLPGFPADVLARFRVYALLAQVLMGGVIALVFAPLAQRVVDPASAERRRAARAPAPVAA